LKSTRLLRMVGMAALAVVLVVTMFASTVSAGQEEVFNNSKLPWRGSWAANIYVYAKAWTDANQNQPEMNVTTWLAHWNGQWWNLESPSNTASGSNTTHVEATARVYHTGGGTFTTYSHHWGTFRTPEGQTYDRYRYCGQPSW
jgi:hypothetical protein